MWSGDKDGLTADAVHVDAGTRLQVIQVDVAILGDQENHIVLAAYLSKKKRVCKDNFDLEKSNWIQVK